MNGEPLVLHILLVEKTDRDVAAFRGAAPDGEPRWEITVAAQPEEALALVRTKPGRFDLLVYNPRPEWMAAAEFCRRLRESGDDVPVFVLADPRMERQAAEAIRAGAVGCAIKDAGGGYLVLLPAIISKVVAEYREHAARRRAEQALRESEERLRAIVESAYDGEFWLGTDGRVEWVNSAVERLTGLTREECLALPTFPGPIVHAQDREIAEKTFLAAVTERTSFNDFAFRIRRKDGADLWVAASWQPISRADGTHAGIRVNLRDISRRKAIEAALRETQARHALAARAGRVGVWEWEPATGALYLDSNLLALAGYEEQDVPGGTSDWTRLVHPDDVQHAIAAFRRNAEAGASHFEGEVRGRNRDGSIRWILVRADLTRDAAGKATRWVGTITDITDQKAAEQRLAEAVMLNARLAALAQDLIAAQTMEEAARRVYDDALALTDSPVGLVGYVDPVTGRLVCPAFSGESWPGGRIEDGRMVFERAAGPWDQAGRDTRGGALARRYLSVPARIGERPVGRITVADAERDYGDRDREVLERLATLLAIAVQRVQAEESVRKLAEALFQSQKMEAIGVLAGGVAHDFNNLLVGMLGNANLALLELPLDSPARPFLGEIERAAERAANLVRQLMAYGGRGRFDLRALDLSAAVIEMSGLLRSSVPRHIEIRLAASGRPVIVQADLGQIRQLVRNLVTNAVEAIGESQGTITLRTGTVRGGPSFFEGAYLWEDLQEGEYGFVEVSDTGCGMDEETRARIFDPFFSTKFTGRGLGLAAVLGIVRGHRGTIKVQSRPGEGSTFAVFVPACPENAEPAGS